MGYHFPNICNVDNLTCSIHELVPFFRNLFLKYFVKECFHASCDFIFPLPDWSDEEKIGAKRKKKMQHFNSFFGDGGAGGPGSVGGGGGGGGANFFKSGLIYVCLHVCSY